MIEKQIKHRFQRCLEILNAVMFEKGVNRNTLTERYGCSKRTIAKDLALLRDIGFNIVYEHGEYTLLTSKIQVPAVPLGKEHILSLFIDSQFLVLTPLERQADNAVKSILSGMSAQEQNFLRNLTNRICLDPVGEFCDPDILLEVCTAQYRNVKLFGYPITRFPKTENWFVTSNPMESISKIGVMPIWLATPGRNRRNWVVSNCVEFGNLLFGEFALHILPTFRFVKR